MSNQNIIYISGSPKKISNTDILLKLALANTGGEFIKLSKFDLKPCNACWRCLINQTCTIKDELTEEIFPLVLKSDGLVIGSPVYFNNVSAITKIFIDRTWCLKGKLRNKIGGAVVVGRQAGAEGAITAINAFMTKHEMLIANRGVSGTAYEPQEILQDPSALQAASDLGQRINELCSMFSKPKEGKLN